MKLPRLHDWDLSPKQAVALQRELASRVDKRPPSGPFALVAGADVSYSRHSNVFYGGVVVWRASDGQVIERREAVRKSAFPYIPGLLSFRESPILLEAFARLESEPDAVMLDGQGYAHPRRFGLACHVGLWLDRPTFGCAKTVLVGKAETPGPAVGDWTPLLDRGEEVGRALRTKPRVAPVFVSIGHGIDLDTAVRIVLACCRGYRLPEPTRQAHLFVNELRLEGKR